MFSGYKRNQPAYIPVTMYNGDGVVVPNIAAMYVTFTALKADGTIMQGAIDGVVNKWTEVTTGGFSGTGVYALTLGPQYTDITGPLVIAVNGGGASTRAEIDLQEDTEADVISVLGSQLSAIRAKTDQIVDGQTPDLPSPAQPPAPLGGSSITDSMPPIPTGGFSSSL